MNAHESLAKRIRELAAQRKKSLAHVADFAGLSRPHLSRILSGETSPTLRTLERLATVLEVPVRDLFE